MMKLETILQIMAATAVIALAILSWTPGDEMIRTGVSGRVEHVLAYSLTMLVCGVAYRARFSMTSIVGGLITYAGVLEMGQHFSPGRTPLWGDFAASSFGVAIGTVVIHLALGVIKRRTPEDADGGA